ncbi:LuxR C-terminal-related transcriptional regulator [Streptomyces massasporeus]|uniref:LuxR C-terminal-related transcriptional regulator n=1 Tax=Streptomyces massasporeus TaxID=67324 RepID=UPI0033E83FE5
MRPLPFIPHPVPPGTGPQLALEPAFVGRVGELERIRHALTSARGARGVLVAGPPGIGKTRLLREAATLAPGRRLISLNCRAGADAPAVMGGEPTTSAMAQMLAEPTRGAARTKAHTWQISVDDADLMDPALLPLLNEAARHPDVKLLVSVTTDGKALPAGIRALWSDHALARMDLQPLGATDVKQLTDSLLSGGLGQMSASLLARMCEGNPRLLLEVARAAVERHMLERDDGCWHFTDDRLPLPTSVLEIIDPYLSALDQDDREILEIVALAGEPRLSHLERLCDAHRLERLEQRDLLRTVEDTAEGSFRPRVRITRPLIRHALSCGMPLLRRRRLLREWMTASGQPASTEPADCVRLAEWHVEALVRPPRALLDRAVEQSLREQSLPSAVRLTRSAWRHYPCEATAQAHARALTAAADFPGLAAFVAGVRGSGPEYVGALRAAEARGLLLQARYAELEAVLPRLPQEEQAYFRTVAQYFQGRFDRAYAAAEALRRTGSEAHALEAGLIMMGSLCHMGLPERALSLYRTLREDLDRAPGGPTRFHADSLEELHASALHYCGRFDEAEGIYWREYTEALEKHHIRVDAQRGLALGHLLHDRGIIEGAVKCATFTSSYQVGWRQWQVKAGIHAALAGSALPVARRPADPLPEGLSMEEAGHCAMFLAVVRARQHHERGDTGAATGVLHDAVASAMADSAHADVVIGLHECARLCLPLPRIAHADLHLEGPFLRARADYAWALETREPKRMGRVARAFADMGVFLFAAEAYAEQARLYQRRGGVKASAAATAQARELLRRCGPVDTPPLRFLGRPATLSDREQTIAGLAARGLQDKEIAERLCLSVRTVGNTLYRVYRKVGAANRRELQLLMAPSGS